MIVTVYLIRHRDPIKDSRVYCQTHEPDAERVSALERDGYETFVRRVHIPTDGETNSWWEANFT